MKKFYTPLLSLLMLFSTAGIFAQNHVNFKVSVYARAYEVQMMQDPEWLESSWKKISSQLDVDKIYLETHRDLLIVDEATLANAIAFFKGKGLAVAGGITYTIDESNLFETFCFTNHEHRQKVRDIITYTARFFDEVILDDFFFTSCKCSLCLEAKGDRSWAGYRTELMTGASKELILDPAKEINPNVKVIIKYPNWYDHFHELGFNLETQPAMFDGLYTGTETRDDIMSNQHLQPYLSYLIFRYFHNLAPGKNGGGWVDTGGMVSYDRYAEQLWLTILAGAPEMTLFDYRQMLYPLREGWLPAWKDQQVSFDYASFLTQTHNATMALTAGHSLQIIDKYAGELGNPYGIKSYKPYHSSGEDFLQNYLGMIGIPMDIVPEFPFDGEIIILTEQAKFDPEVVSKIEKRLLAGKDVMITSGLLNALQDRGIRNLVNLEYTSRKAMVNNFLMGWRIVEGNKPVMIPQIQYFTNDSWEVISGMDGRLGWPLLHMARIADATLYVLTIPENFSDLYKLPVEVLNRIRETVSAGMGVTLQGPARVSLFAYDNNTLVVHSFNDTLVEVDIVLQHAGELVFDLTAGMPVGVSVIPEINNRRGRVITPERYSIRLQLPPHSFRVIKTG